MGVVTVSVHSQPPSCLFDTLKTIPTTMRMIPYTMNSEFTQLSFDFVNGPHISSLLIRARRSSSDQIAYS